MTPAELAAWLPFTHTDFWLARAPAIALVLLAEVLLGAYYRRRGEPTAGHRILRELRAGLIAGAAAHATLSSDYPFGGLSGLAVGLIVGAILTLVGHWGLQRRLLGREEREPQPLTARYVGTSALASALGAVIWSLVGVGTGTLLAELGMAAMLLRGTSG